MSKTVEDVKQLQEYIQGVMRRAEHHAGDVDEIALTIAGAIIWRKESQIKVRAQEGEMKNVLWVNANGGRYAFSYNHETGKIEAREGSVRGEVLAAFSNETSNSEVKEFFSQC